MSHPRCLGTAIVLLALSVPSCATADPFLEEYEPYASACEQDDSAKLCVNATIVAEFQAYEARKAGEHRAARAAWKRAYGTARRACNLGDPKACNYADVLASRL